MNTKVLEKRVSTIYSQQLTDALFQNPTSEYRGTPFWAWNTKLSREILSEQINYLKEMGFGGFHIHPRTGLETPYLGDEFMTLVAHCVAEAKEKQMLAWLYDEDRWPSGFAGGLVTRHPDYRARYLLFTPTPYGLDDVYQVDGDSASRGSRNGKGRLIATYDIHLNEAGNLITYRRLGDNEEGTGIKWYAYLEVAQPSAWFNNQTYVDTLNPEAIQQFILTTYERYKQCIEDEFGKTVPAIFTDEPQFTHKTTLAFAHQQKDIILPWTDDLPDTYEAYYGESLLEKLPELFWELGKDQISVTRYRYHDHIAERFATAFADQCGEWCVQNGLMLTGHMMEEPTLQSQTAALGEAMRSYRAFGLPGIDILCDSREYNTAKQAQSAARQFGRPGVLSELYGVTNWDFDFRGHKLQGDWQAALGITVRVPHLSWVSMKGESKRDYPASIGYQSPWYRAYPLIEDHFARLNTVLSQGKAVVKIGVIHPIESYWLHFGPHEQTRNIREEKERHFSELTQWLLGNQLDFDFIAESLLPRQCNQGGYPLQVGEMCYDAIIVPACETLRHTTYERLVAFQEAGGLLIFLGQAPRYKDAQPSEAIDQLYKMSVSMPFEEASILKTLEGQRDVRVLRTNRHTEGAMFYQMREDQQYRWLFICQANRTKAQDTYVGEEVTIEIKGDWQVTLYDTLTGEITPITTHYAENNTYVPYTFYAHSSVLLRLEKGKGVVQEESKKQAKSSRALRLPQQVAFRLEEPNVCLLDTAAYCIDDKAYEEEEEILRLDNQCRAALGYLPRGGQVAQPWVLEQEELAHTVTLCFTIESEVDVDEVWLATEDAEAVEVWMNGIPVTVQIEGYYVDRAIQKIRLPQIHKGRNQLEVRYPFGKTTHLEWCYLLGNFGVRVEGNQKTLIQLPHQLAFGDLVPQGLPFYGGNVVYRLPVDVTSPELSVHIPCYRGTLLEVQLDDVDVKPVVFAPYECCFYDVASGVHTIEIKLYGSRVNTFGPVHNCNTQWQWFGPDAWRSVGDSWSDAYCLKPVGILTVPQIEERIF